MLGFENFLLQILSSHNGSLKIKENLKLDKVAIESYLNLLLDPKLNESSSYSLITTAWHYAKLLENELDLSCKGVCFDTQDHNEFVLTLLALSFLNKDIFLLSHIDPNNLNQDSAYLSSANITNIISKASNLALCGSLNHSQELISAALKSQSKIIVFTSGSTGEPKAIIKTFELMLKEVELFSSKVKLDLESVLLSSVSPFHLYGLSFTVFMPLCLGISIINHRIEFPEDLCAYQKMRCILISSPAFLARIDNQLIAPNFSLVLSAGGKLDFNVAQRFFDWSKCHIREIYGSSETGIIATTIPNDGISVFEPFEGLVFTKDEQAIIVLSSPLIYEGQLILDDELEFMDNNTFVIKGRRDRIVKIGDKRFNLSALENKLKEHNKVLDACLITINLQELSVISEVKRERLAALIAIEHPEIYEDKSKKKALVQELKELLKSSYELLSIPRYWRFCSAIPTNSMGKRSQKEVQKYFLNK